MTDPRTGGDELRERLRPYMRNGKGELRGNVHVPIGVAVYLRRTGQWAIPADLVDDVLACLDSHSPQDSEARDRISAELLILRRLGDAPDVSTDGYWRAQWQRLRDEAILPREVFNIFRDRGTDVEAVRAEVASAVATPDSEPSGDVPAEHAWTVADTAPLRFVKDHAAGMDVPPFYTHCQHCGVSRTASEYFGWRRCSKAPRLTLRTAAPVPATGMETSDGPV